MRQHTISEAEKTAVIDNYNWFRFEGIGFFACPSQISGSSPVYRFFNTSAGGHFFTLSESEKNAVLENYKWFRFEGTGFYATPLIAPPPKPIPPITPPPSPPGLD